MVEIVADVNVLILYLVKGIRAQKS